ncbi:MAG: response regulator transcription factor [Chitinophagales bacterium]|nr:response regulator transcription factor [Chitinophagales bacterium]
MNRLTAIIIDDEKNSANALKLSIEEFENSVDVIKVCHTAKDALDYLQEHSPDIIFLDIEMPKMNGFDLLDRLNGNLKSHIIFTTAYNQYAIQAIEHNALDYLLKPVDINKLHKSIEKVKNKMERKQQVFQSKSRHSAAHNKIYIPTAEGITFLDIEDIIRCESDNNYTMIYTKNHQRIMISKTLGDVEIMLEPYAIFCRIHQSHIVNTKCIIKYLKQDGGAVELIDGSIVEISRRKKDEFLKKMGL